MSPDKHPLPGRSAGALRVLRTALSVLPDAPGIVVVYVVLAFVTGLSTTIGNLLSAAVLGFAITLAAGVLQLDTEGEPSNSLGVRLLLAVIAAIVAGFVILIGIVFLVLPGLYLAIRLRLVAASVMLEDSGPLEALSRSFELTKGHTLTVFGVWAATTLLNVLVASVVVLALLGGVPSLDSQAALQALQGALSVGAAAGTLVSGPLIATSDAVLFGMYAGSETTAQPTDPTASVAERP
ncbi:hypothetical protein [Halarchaeum sp. P4]|uniref:hypothetical protein n=1 Tax=Halarchaeum sp. P4 TaxID=3421639 RepID=UPI003EB847F3